MLALEFYYNCRLLELSELIILFSTLYLFTSLYMIYILYHYMANQVSIHWYQVDFLVSLRYSMYRYAKGIFGCSVPTSVLVRAGEPSPRIRIVFDQYPYPNIVSVFVSN